MKQAIENYVNILQSEHDKYHAKMFPNLHTTYNGHYYVFAIEYGKKFAKINYRVDGGKGQQSVSLFCRNCNGQYIQGCNLESTSQRD